MVGAKPKAGLFSSAFPWQHKSENGLLTEAPRRAFIARLPSRYLVDADASMTVAHAYGAATTIDA